MTHVCAAAVSSIHYSTYPVQGQLGWSPSNQEAGYTPDRSSTIQIRINMHVFGLWKEARYLKRVLLVLLLHENGGMDEGAYF